MPKSLVGKVKNEKFTFFWLLIGGSIGNVLLILYSLNIWPIFLPSAILSILIAITIVNKIRRPKIWLGIDMLITSILLILFAPFFGTAEIKLVIFLPSVLIILGCIFGIMNW